MDPATSIIDLFGGAAKVAEIVGRHRTRVSLWRLPRRRGGTDGRIPQSCFHPLMDAAKKQGIPLTAEQLIGIPEAAR